MASIVTLITLIASTWGSAPEKTLATQFGHPGDRWAGRVFACPFKDGKVQRYWGPGTRIKRLDPRVYGLAHRTAPCGTLIRVRNLRTGKSITAPVVDRGPYWQVPKTCSPFQQRCWNRGRINRKRVTRLLPGYKWSHKVDVLPIPAGEAGLSKTPASIQILK